MGIPGKRNRTYRLLNNKSIVHPMASLVAQMVKRLPAVQETRVQSLGWEDPLEKKMATHSSSLAWKIPWTEEPSRLKESDTTEQLHFHVHFHSASNEQREGLYRWRPVQTTATTLKVTQES